MTPKMISLSFHKLGTLSNAQRVYISTRPWHAENFQCGRMGEGRLWPPVGWGSFGFAQIWVIGFLDCHPTHGCAHPCPLCAGGTFDASCSQALEQLTQKAQENPSIKGALEQAQADREEAARLSKELDQVKTQFAKQKKQLLDKIATLNKGGSPYCIICPLFGSA